MTTILAEVKRRIEGEEGANAKFALLTPLYIAQSGSWGPITDPKEQFPNNGEVVWWNPPAYAQVGAVVRTTLVKVSVTDERFAAYRVDVDEPFDVFFDMRGEPDAVEMRRKLASGGFTFTKKPVGRQLLKNSSAENEWIGPLDLTFHQNQNSRWESGPASNTGFVTIRSVAEEKLQELVIQDFTNKCLRPEGTLGGPIGKFSAQTDQQLIESLLKRLRKIDVKTAAALNVTKDVFNSYVTVLASAQLIDSQDEIEHVREEALRLLMTKLDADGAWADATASSLIDHPRVSVILDTAIRAEIERRAERIEAKAKKDASEIAAQVSEKTVELESLDNSLLAKQAELLELEKDLASKNASLREVSDQAADQLSLLVEQVLADPVKELGKNALVRALSGRSNSNDSPSLNRKLATDSVCYAELEECLGALDTAARTLQQNPRSLQACLSALFSGRPVVVVGAKSSELISAFCSVIAKDFAAKVNVPTDIFGVSDLFGLPVSPYIGGGFPPMSLAEYFGKANDLGVCFPLVLVGANRAPMETALLDILLGSSALSSTQVAVQLGGPPTRLDKIKVERSAFLMNTLAGGESVFRPHPEFLRSALFVDSDRAPAEAFPGAADVKLPAMSISALSLNDWQDKGLEVSDSAIRTLENTPNWLEGEYGSLRETGIFCQVFGNEAVGLAEWLLAKYGYSQSSSELLSLAQGCGGQVEAALESILEDADIQSIAGAGGNTNS